MQKPALPTYSLTELRHLRLKVLVSLWLPQHQPSSRAAAELWEAGETDPGSAFSQTGAAVVNEGWADTGLPPGSLGGKVPVGFQHSLENMSQSGHIPTVLDYYHSLPGVWHDSSAIGALSRRAFFVRQSLGAFAMDKSQALLIAFCLRPFP